MEKGITCKKKSAGSRGAILISDKIYIDCQKSQRRRHYIIIKGLIQEENITFLNIYAPNTGTLKHILTDVKGENQQQHIILGTLCVCVKEFTNLFYSKTYNMGPSVTGNENRQSLLRNEIIQKFLCNKIQTDFLQEQFSLHLEIYIFIENPQTF